MEKNGDKNKGKTAILTHPSSEKRIENLNNWITEVIIGTTNKDLILVSPDGLEPSTPSLKGGALPTELRALKIDLLYTN